MFFVLFFFYSMAAVNEEIISSMFKSNFSNLKSFAEMLNAEFTEEGHGND